MSNSIYFLDYQSGGPVRTEFIVNSKEVVPENPQIEAIAGNLCSCTGYIQILEVAEAAGYKVLS
jgi:xanthine dehydrogenase iron-sulfur cluster and FAD-binding subunit A|tara:strand:+ start:1472 stop:1663 length:192 start_codon:yes stop_codon:yes gene_type:complete